MVRFDFVAILTTTLLIGTAVAQSTTEISSGESCYSAATFTYAYDGATSVFAPNTGTIVGIHPVYVSGSVTCDYRIESYASKFGCGYQNGQLMTALYRVTASDPFTSSLMYPSGETAVTGIHTDDEITLMSPSFDVTEGEEFLFVYTESFGGYSTGDNSGTACAEIFFIYDSETVVDDRCGTMEIDFFLEDCSTAFSDSATEVTALADRVTATEGDISSMASRVSTNEGDISSHGGRVSVNEGDIATLTERVDESEQSIATLSGLQAQVDGLVGQLADLEGRLSGEAAAAQPAPAGANVLSAAPLFTNHSAWQLTGVVCLLAVNFFFFLAVVCMYQKIAHLTKGKRDYTRTRTLSDNSDSDC